MSCQHRSGVGVLCALAIATLAALPGCEQTPRNHPDGVNGLLGESTPPSEHIEAFVPVPEEELAHFELPEPAAYRLGIGDTVRVTVLSTQPVVGFSGPIDARVREDGRIRLPSLGKVEAEGKTAIDLEDDLTKPIQANFLKDAVVSVEVTGFASRNFFVVGQVASPGTLPVNGKTTLLEALIASGGTNHPQADREEAYVVRDQQAIPFSIDDLVMRGHPIGRLVMQQHDIVFVPSLRDRQDFVYMFGEVGKPRRVPFDKLNPRDTKGSLTLAAALAEAGGLNTRADINSVTIYRGTWKDPKVYRVGIDDIYHYGGEIYLHPGDRIAVGTSAATKFSDALAPGLQLIGATSSGLSLALSTVALSKK